MVTSTIHSPSDLRPQKIVISQDELREILIQVESEFCQSEIYQRAVGGLQKRLDQASVNVQLLIQALGREAIRLALRQVVQQYRDEEAQPCAQASSAQASSLQAVNSESSALASSQASFRESTQESTPEIAAVGDGAELTRSANSVPQSPLQTELQAALNPETAVAHAQGGDAATLAAAASTVAPAPVKKAGVATPEPSQPTDAQQTPQPTRAQPTIRVSGRLTNHSAEERSPNQSARGEALQQIGLRLQQARLRKSWSIYDIHQQTRVPLHQIQSLELGEIDHLPEDIYVRGFIRRIAEVVDLESAALLELLPRPFHEANLLPTWHGPTQTAHGSDLKTKTLKNQQHLRPLHLYLGYAALMTGAAGGLTWIAQQPIDGLNFDNFSLEALPDIPEFIHNLAPIQVFKQEMQNFSQQRSQSNTQGAIAQPETIPVESSTPSGY